MNQGSIKKLVQMALLIALEILLTFTPLGFIYIPFLGINATLVHIPVIIGGSVLGCKSGAVLGGVFGICSMINSTIRPGITAFVFSPFISASSFGALSAIKSIVVALIPRILIGVISGLIARTLERKNKKLLFITGICGSLTNTILVMTSIYFMFGTEYATAIGKPFSALFGYILTIIAINGTCEAVLAALVTAAVIPVIRRFGETNNNE